MRRLVMCAVAFLLTLGLGAEDLEMQAKFVKVLVSSTGQFGICCNNDPALKKTLEQVGISVSPGFKLAWAASEAEVKTLKADGRLVVVPKLEWLKLGAGIAVVNVEGLPQLYVNMVNVKASGLTLPDAIIKIAKKI
ncbi:MAG TPA: hypothetical protein PKM35_14625 [Holophaga sp.]|nr:hypothetical protein [Holophaga sp.]HPS68864.1 hypothetical protein [Holophaga sp.]